MILRPKNFFLVKIVMWIDPGKTLQSLESWLPYASILAIYFTLFFSFLRSFQFHVIKYFIWFWISEVKKQREIEGKNNQFGLMPDLIIQTLILKFKLRFSNQMTSLLCSYNCMKSCFWLLMFPWLKIYDSFIVAHSISLSLISYLSFYCKLHSMKNSGKIAYY